MSKSPFNNEIKTGRYVNVIMEQFDGMEVGDSIEANLFGGSVSKFRMSLKYSSGPRGVKFKTKMSNGSLWVMRVE